VKRYVRVAAIQALPQSETLEELMDGRDVPHALDLLDRTRGEEELRRRAREAGVYVICGLREDIGNGQAYNTATVIDDRGEIAGRQRKVFPTAIEVTGGIVSGDSYPVFTTPLGRIGVIICADLPFSRRGITELKRQNVDIIFNPSWWFALGEAYPASVIGRHLEYGMPIFGVDIARHALSHTAEDGVTTEFPAAGGYTTATITPPCRSVEELGEWFRTKPGGINAMSDFVTTLGEEEDILRATVDLEAVRNFPGYYFSESATAVTAAGLVTV
jgi:predicted amidohydrolase